MGMAGKALCLLSEVSDVSVTCPAGGRYSGYMLIWFSMCCHAIKRILQKNLHFLRLVVYSLIIEEKVTWNYSGYSNLPWGECTNTLSSFIFNKSLDYEQYSRRTGTAWSNTFILTYLTNMANCGKQDKKQLFLFELTFYDFLMFQLNSILFI